MQLENFLHKLITFCFLFFFWGNSELAAACPKIGSGKTSWMQNGISIGVLDVRQAISNVIADAIQNTNEVQLNY